MGIAWMFRGLDVWRAGELVPDGETDEIVEGGRVRVAPLAKMPLDGDTSPDVSPLEGEVTS